MRLSNPLGRTPVVIAPTAIAPPSAGDRMGVVKMEEGALAGDLYLRGGGDPTLSTDDLRNLATALRQAGVKRITGNFFYDDSLLPSTRELEPKQPIAVSYNPGLSALSVNYNRVFLRWKRKAKRPIFTTSIL